MAKLTPAEVRFFLAEAKSCEDRQKKELTERNNYPHLINYYEGFWKVSPVGRSVGAATESMIISEYFPNTNALISEIMYQNPDIMVEATKPEAEDNQELMKAALTYAFDKTGALLENRLALFDMLYAGFCAVEVGHLKDEKIAKMLPGEQEIADRNVNPVAEMVNNVKSFLGIAKDEKEAEKNLEKNQPSDEENNATSEKTYIKRWNPLNILLDWRADTAREQRYQIKKVFMSKAEFDTSYPEFKDKIQVGQDILDYSSEQEAKDKAQVMLYEFQIRQKDGFWNLVVCPNYPEQELDLYKRPYITNGFDIKIGMLNNYGKLYPISYAQMNKKLADEMEHYVRFIMEVGERNVPKFVADKNKIKADAEVALRSKVVNDIAYVDGNPANAVLPQTPTQASVENKQLLEIFSKQKEKLWNISESRLQGKSDADFATEMQIQEAGFQASRVDIQEGLRVLLVEECEALKDIIVQFWNGEYFFKVTGGQMPGWYAPQVVQNPLTGQPMVQNALTDILTADYEVKIDITSSLRPNREKMLKGYIEYLTWLMSPAVQEFLTMQGQMVNIEAIKKSATMAGLNADNIFINIPAPAAGQVPPSPLPGQPQGVPSAGLPVPMPGLPQGV